MNDNVASIQPKLPNKNRGWQRVLLIIIPFIFIGGIFQYIGLLVAQVDLKDLDNIHQTSEQHLITTSFDLLGVFITIWIFMKFVDKEKLINLGFYTQNRFKDFTIGIGLGAFIMLTSYFFLILTNEINFEKIIFSIKDILISLLVFSMVAILEEVLLRGYILRNLMISFNKYVALVISSILFSLLHAFNPNIDLFSMAGLFLAGLLLGASYIHTKNLWFPIALHLSWNLFQTLFGFNVSGQDFYSLIEFNIEQNNLLNGGVFGFEGSILSIVIEVMLIIGIIAFYNIKKPSTVKPLS